MPERCQGAFEVQVRAAKRYASLLLCAASQSIRSKRPVSGRLNVLVGIFPGAVHVRAKEGKTHERVIFYRLVGLYSTGVFRRSAFLLVRLTLRKAMMVSNGE